NDLSASIQHDVRWLHVTVKHTFRVCSCKTCAKLAGDVECLVRRKPANTAKQGSQIFAIHIFHGEKVVAVYLSNVIYPANIRVGNPAGSAYFIVKTFQQTLVLGCFVGKKLQSNRLAQS